MATITSDVGAGVGQSTTVLTTADGTPLQVSLARAQRRQRLQAMALVAPLFLFILITFFLPIADMLMRSVQNEIVPDTLPRTVRALAAWDPAKTKLPDQTVDLYIGPFGTYKRDGHCFLVSGSTTGDCG